MIGLIFAMAVGVPTYSPFGSPPPGYKLLAPEVRFAVPKASWLHLGVQAPVLLGGNYLASTDTVMGLCAFAHLEAPIMDNGYLYVRGGPAVFGSPTVGLAAGPQVMTEIGIGAAPPKRRGGLGLRFGWLHYSNGSMSVQNEGLNYLSANIEVRL